MVEFCFVREQQHKMFLSLNSTHRSNQNMQNSTGAKRGLGTHTHTHSHHPHTHTRHYYGTWAWEITGTYLKVSFHDFNSLQVLLSTRAWCVPHATWTTKKRGGMGFTDISYYL